MGNTNEYSVVRSHKNASSIAKDLPLDRRIQILSAISETELHKVLCTLYKRMESSWLIEVTHGTQEFGKDLVAVALNSITPLAVAVVVKKGDINGKTSSDIDNIKAKITKIDTFNSNERRSIKEITSQITQSLDHPAEISKLIRTIPINKIIVIVAGKLSRNARERIDKELDKRADVDIKDITEVVNLLTLHYPEFFFQNESLTYIENEIFEIEISEARNINDKQFSEYFVEQSVSRFSFPSINSELDFEQIESILQKDKLSKSLSSMVKVGNRKKIILVGDPGSGKSGILKKIALDHYKNGLETAVKVSGELHIGISIPVLLEAKDFINEVNTETFLTETAYIPKEVQEVANISAILVDGLDEVKKEDREKVLKNAHILSEHFNCSLVVTSRKVDLVSKNIVGFDKFEILPYEFSEALQLCGKLLNKNSSMLKLIKEGLKKIKDHFPLTPLSVKMLINTIEREKEIPATITELYSIYFDDALGKNDVSKGVNIFFDPEAKKRFLSILAYKYFVLNNTIEISKYDFDLCIDSYCNTYQYSKEHLKELIDEIERSCILKTIPESGKIAFSHKSFLDYFAAWYVFYNADDFDNINEYISNLYYEGFWSEVSFFYIGLKKEIKRPLLRYLFPNITDNTDFDYLVQRVLTGRLLQAGWHSEYDIILEALRKSLEAIPILYDDFLQRIRNRNLLVPQNDKKTPIIYIDIFLAMISDESFNSKTLIRLLEILLIELEEIHEGFEEHLVLLWAVRDKMEQDKFTIHLNNFINKVSTLNNVDTKARMLTFAKIIAPDTEKALSKSISRRLDKIMRRNGGHLESFRQTPAPTIKSLPKSLNNRKRK